VKRDYADASELNNGPTVVGPDQDDDWLLWCASLNKQLRSRLEFVLLVLIGHWSSLACIDKTG
jgi:hypothetical protein